jgi:transposase
VRHREPLGARADSARSHGSLDTTGVCETVCPAQQERCRRCPAIKAQVRANPTARRLITIPGFGPILSGAIAAIVTDPRHFDSGRDFAAALGLVPRQDGTGGKVKLGPISKRGNGYLRRLLVNGATAVLHGKNARTDPWRARLLDGKPRKLAAVALANKMARIAWAVMTRQEDFRPRAVAA